MFLILTALSGRKYQRNRGSVFQPLRGALIQTEAHIKVECSLDFVQLIEVVYVSKQKAFNKSLVDRRTQVIFMDEAHVKLLDPDDWKVFTQGELTAHDRNTEALANRKFDVPCSSPAKRKWILGKSTTRPWKHVYASAI